MKEQRASIAISNIHEGKFIGIPLFI